MSSFISFTFNKCYSARRIKEDEIGYLGGDEKCIKMLVGKRDGNRRLKGSKYIMEANI
jgi:hypothetical protein